MPGRVLRAPILERIKKKGQGSSTADVAEAAGTFINEAKK
jgi:hypothetical protein